MITIQVSIIDYVNGQRNVNKYEIESATRDSRTIDIMHESVSRRHPDSFVNFAWGNSWIAGMRYNQRQDEIRLDKDEITWEEYSARWYPELQA